MVNDRVLQCRNMRGDDRFCRERRPLPPTYPKLLQREGTTQISGPSELLRNRVGFPRSTASTASPRSERSISPSKTRQRTNLHPPPRCQYHGTRCGHPALAGGALRERANEDIRALAGLESPGKRNARRSFRPRQGGGTGAIGHMMARTRPRSTPRASQPRSGPASPSPSRRLTNASSHRIAIRLSKPTLPILGKTSDAPECEKNGRRREGGS